MKIIDKRTGIDILSCNDINSLRDIIIDNQMETLKLMEEYGFFLLSCDRNNLPLVTPEDWLNIKIK